MTTDFDALQAIIDASPLSEDDRRHVKASLWMQQEVPEISSAEQYDTYGRLSDQLSSSLPDRASPEFGGAFADWSRSSAGVLSVAYGARMVEWEERQEAGSPGASTLT